MFNPKEEWISMGRKSKILAVSLAATSVFLFTGVLFLLDQKKETPIMGEAQKKLDPNICNQLETADTRAVCLAEVEKTMNVLKKQNIVYAGSLYYNAGNYEEAINAYAQAIEKNDPLVTDQVYLDLAVSYGIKGLQLHKEGEYVDKGLKITAELKKNNPRNLEVYRVEGYLYEIKPDLLLAGESYTKALEINPNYALAYAGRCHVKQMQGFISGAIDDCHKADELDSQGKIPGIAAQLCNLEKSDEALVYCQKVLDSRNALLAQKSSATRTMARIYLEKGDVEKALDLSKKALQIGPQDPNNYVLLAMIHNQSGDYGLAQENAEKSIKIDSMKAVAYGEMGISFLNRNELEKAQEAFQKALDLIPLDPSLLLPSKGPFKDQYCGYLREIAEKQQRPFDEKDCL
jgi:tetratricopeptide (TPR) repeat protein